MTKALVIYQFSGLCNGTACWLEIDLSSKTCL